MLYFAISCSIGQYVRLVRERMRNNTAFPAGVFKLKRNQGTFTRYTEIEVEVKLDLTLDKSWEFKASSAPVGGGGVGRLEARWTYATGNCMHLKFRLVCPRDPIKVSLRPQPARPTS